MHTLQCYSNPHADVETAADWEATLPDEYSGIWADDLIAVANSQTGYFESIDNYQVIENTKEYNGYTRYGAWNEEPYADWSMDFTAFCLHYAAVDPELFPVDTEGIDLWVKALLKAENISERADETEYAPGDIILFTPTKEKGRNVPHMGIITKADKKTVTVVEGDRDNAVVESVYKKGSSTIAAVFALPEKPDPEVTSGQAADESSNDSFNEPESGEADEASEEGDADSSMNTEEDTAEDTADSDNGADDALADDVEDTDTDADVIFSTPSLVQVERVEEDETVDWVLTSLEPFDSEETLTITMENGDVITLRVTDEQEVEALDAIDVNRSYVICTHDDNGYHVLKADGSVETFANTNNFDKFDDSILVEEVIKEGKGNRCRRRG